MASKPSRPCKEPGCNDMGFIKREEGDGGPMIFCPKCVVPFITERPGYCNAPGGTKANNWGMPLAEQAQIGPGQRMPERIPKTKAQESRNKQNAAALGYRGDPAG